MLDVYTLLHLELLLPRPRPCPQVYVVAGLLVVGEGVAVVPVIVGVLVTRLVVIIPAVAVLGVTGVVIIVAVLITMTVAGGGIVVSTCFTGLPPPVIIAVVTSASISVAIAAS